MTRLSLALLAALGLALWTGQARAGQPMLGYAGSFGDYSLLGNYLAGRYASRQRDYVAAARSFELALSKDPGNAMLVRRAFISQATAGNIPRAATLARQVLLLNFKDRRANIFLGVRAFKSGELDKAADFFKKAKVDTIGEFTGTLALAWVSAAKGDTDGALTLLRGTQRAQWARFYWQLHRGLIADVGGNKEAARQAYEQFFRREPRTLRLTLAYARHAMHYGDAKLARQILSLHLKKVRRRHSLAVSAMHEIRRGNRPELLVTNAVDGLAELFYGLGEVLVRDRSYREGAIYLQLALYLKPDFPLALNALGNLHELTKHYEMAVAAYERIPESSPLWFDAKIRSAWSLNYQEEVDGARTLLNKLVASIDTSPLPGGAAKAAGQGGSAKLRLAQAMLKKIGLYDGPGDGLRGPNTVAAIKRFQARQAIAQDGVLGPETLDALSVVAYGRSPAFARERKMRALLTLGDIMRSHKKYGPAADYYSDALELIDRPTPVHWNHYYARGMCYERLKKWPLAEADLKLALKLNPNQAHVLNYLGYSWIDQNLQLNKAMALIRKAVSLRPNDGYIVDSLGWAYYRLGNYKAAAKYLERAVILKPNDPVINDHLGDAYWQVGRRLEATFQWKHALSFEPEPQDAIKINIKLKEGLGPKKAVPWLLPKASKPVTSAKSAKSGDEPFVTRD